MGNIKEPSLEQKKRGKSFNDSARVSEYLRDMGYELRERLDESLFGEDGNIDLAKEIELAKETESAGQDALKAKQKLINSHLRLVFAIAYEHYREDGFLKFLDLIQAGSEGLIKAVDKFDYKKGRLSTYATFGIRKAIIKTITDESREIRLPAEISALINKIRKARNELAPELGRDPTSEEIAERVGYTLEELNKKVPRHELLKLLGATKISSKKYRTGSDEEDFTDDFIEDESAVGQLEEVSEEGDFIEENSAADQLKEVLEEIDRTKLFFLMMTALTPEEREEVLERFDIPLTTHLSEQITSALADLTPREEQVLRKRFGIGEKE